MTFEPLCTCNRAFVHCRACGAKGVYGNNTESQRLSAIHNRRIIAYKCKRCLAITSEVDQCIAPLYMSVSNSLKAQSDELRKDPEAFVKKMNQAGKTPAEVIKAFQDAGVVVVETIIDAPKVKPPSSNQETQLEDEPTLDEILAKMNLEKKGEPNG